MLADIMKIFETSSPVNHEQYQTIAIYLLVNFVSKLLNRQKLFLRMVLIYKINSEINSAVYLKLLRLSPVKDKDDQEEGEILNLSQTDSSRIGLAIVDAVYFLTMVISIGICVRKMLNAEFYPFVATLIVIVIFIFLIVFFSVLSGPLNEKLLEKKDARIKVTSDTFMDIKTFKLLGWDMEFLKRVFV